MAESTKKKKKWIEKIHDHYKFVIMDDEDMREISNYTLSLKNIYLLILTTLLIITGIIVFLIAFTPIKSLIPGYGKLENDKAYQSLFTKVEDLENKLKAQDVYTIGLQNMLKGIEESQSKDDSEGKEATQIGTGDISETKKTGILNQFLFSVPMNGSISQEYDPKSEHFGIDILAPKNTPVKTILDGAVIYAGWSVEAGNMIYIQHPKNIISSYKHNSSLLVKTGQRVNAGQAIAIIGNTGTLSSGPHLHFELWYDGLPVNPINYITFQ